jgi:carboxypeptidase C (cathepsin A)
MEGRTMLARITATLLAALLFLLPAASPPVLAQDAGKEPAKEAASGGKPAREAASSGSTLLSPADSTTQHTLRLKDGREIRYTATAGMLPVRDGKGETQAEIFYVAYVADPPSPERPLTFAFNGGPGAASAYLHLGALGPRRLVFAPDGTIPSPPAQLVDNEDTWLAFTDLVFVDPVGTGYSRTTDQSEDARKRFWGVEQDGNAMAAVIRLYTARAGRSLSPKFLAGESYGGFRAALLAHKLQGETGIAPSGAVLISPALEFSLLSEDDYQAVTWITHVPSFAAVNLATAKGVGDRDALAASLHDAESFAAGDYLTYLAAGSSAGREREQAVWKRLADLTGLPPAIVEQARGRIGSGTFIKEYARAQGRLLSRYDGTVSGPDPYPTSTRPRGPDPILDRSVAPWTSAFIAYVRDELGYRTDLPYRLLNREVGGRWDYGTTASHQGFAGVMDDLREARALNPKLRVMIAHGLTDLTTPYFGTRYLLNQMPPMPGAAPVDLKLYAGGHMMYMRPDSRRALAADAASLYRDAVSASIE